MMLPKVLDERQVHLFKFYRDEGVNPGMRYDGHLYRLVDRQNPGDRLKAYEVATTLTNLGYSAIVTVSNYYCVWVPMTAQTGTQLDSDLIALVVALVQLDNTAAETIASQMTGAQRHGTPANPLARNPSALARTNVDRPVPVPDVHALSQRLLHGCRLLLEGSHSKGVWFSCGLYVLIQQLHGVRRSQSRYLTKVSQILE